MNSLWITGCFSGAIAVTTGAFGAHALPTLLKTEPQSDITRKVENWRTAAHYQLIHSIAILFASQRSKVSWGNRAGLCFLLGSVLFSGSIYGLVLLPPRSPFKRMVGLMTPVGGLCFIAGWSFLALA